MNKTFLAIALAAACSTALAAGDPAAGKQKSASCAACHGADGNSQIPGNPILAGQYASYLVHALEAYQAGTRSNPIMAGMAKPLSEQDIADLAAYFSSQGGLKVLDPSE
jgi:cytochrome c553